MWFETKTETRYELPDMTKEHINAAHRQLDSDVEKVMVMNISNALLLLPKMIIAKAGVGDRCFWEAHAD